MENINTLENELFAFAHLPQDIKTEQAKHLRAKHGLSHGEFRNRFYEVQLTRLRDLSTDNCRQYQDFISDPCGHLSNTFYDKCLDCKSSKGYLSCQDFDIRRKTKW